MLTQTNRKKNLFLLLFPSFSQPIIKMGLSVISILTFLILSQPMQAAEKIILKYSILRKPVSVAELSQLAKNGDVSPALKSYLKIADKDPQELQNALNQTLEVDQVIFPQVLNSFVGNIILDQIGEVIHPPARRASRESLREALLKSARDDNKVQVIEVIENYPTSEIHVEGERLVEMYSQVQGIIDKIPSISL